MLIKIGEDSIRVLELQHVTPGNLRGFVRVKFRNIRNGTLSDQKLRSEDSLDRAVLDEREMQYLYRDGDSFHFMDTSIYEQLHIDTESLGDSVNYLIPDALIRWSSTERSRSASSCRRPWISSSRTRPRDQGGDGERAGQAGRARDGPRGQVPPFVNPGDKVRVSTSTGDRGLK